MMNITDEIKRILEDIKEEKKSVRAEVERCSSELAIAYNLGIARGMAYAEDLIETLLYKLLKYSDVGNYPSAKAPEQSNLYERAVSPNRKP
jgi:hypothetical protein